MKKSILLALLSMAVIRPFAQPAKTPTDKKFNIVLFIADDLGYNDIEPYGNKFVKTPNLSKLAKQSLQFSKAFASSPTCTPSRCTIFTGLMPIKHGAHGNHSAVATDTKSLVQYLNPLGYKVALAGKLHVGPEEVFAFEKIADTNVPEPGFEGRAGLNYDLNLDPVDDWLGKQQRNEPFMLVVADHSPHVIWPEKPTYNPEKVDIPSIHVDTRETRISRTRYYTDITKMDENVGKLLKSLEKHHLVENTIVIFTSDQGPQWPFAKWTLYDYGVQVPLLVRWPGVVKPAKTEALVSLADVVPTAVAIAGGIVPAGIDGQSFLPILLQQKNTQRNYVYASHTGDGAMNRSPARMVRNNQYKYILNLAPEILYTTHMDRAKDHDGGREYWDSWLKKSFMNEHAASVLWRYHNHPKEEFYDVKADPEEKHNLADDGNYQSMLGQFRKEMSDWRNQQKDTITGPENLNEIRAKKPAKPLAPYIF